MSENGKLPEPTDEEIKEELDIEDHLKEKEEEKVDEVDILFPHPTEEEYKESWDNGVIGKMEQFIQRRWNVGPMWARAIPSSLVSVAGHNVILYDEEGGVTTCIFVLWVSPSGTSKTPTLIPVRKILREFNPDLLAPAKFTPEGFTEWVTGGKEESIAHPNNIVIRDEFSVLLKEKKGHLYMSAILEYLSNLWNGYIEGYYTRSHGFEGDLDVFVTMLAAGSDDFLANMEEEFFTQGLGNRILWNDEPPPPAVKRDAGKYFYEGDLSFDPDQFSLKNDVIGMLKRIEEVKEVFIQEDAAQIFVNFKYSIECTRKANPTHEESLVYSYMVKQSLNALKLSMVYALARLNIEAGCLMVTGRDMLKAIEDVQTYYEMRNRIMKKWRVMRERRKRENLPAERHTVDTVIEAMVDLGGRFTIGDLYAETNVSRPTLGNYIIGCMEQGWVKEIAKAGEQGKLTDEEYKRLRNRGGRGPTSAVYEVTPEGRKRIA